MNFCFTFRNNDGDSVGRERLGVLLEVLLLLRALENRLYLLDETGGSDGREEEGSA